MKIPYPSPHGFRDRLSRFTWSIVWRLFFCTSPRPFHGWRRFLLRAFGAEIARGCNVYPTARVWAPWKLKMEEFSSLGPAVDCYNVGGVTIGKFTTVSQYSYLCGATHDYTRLSMPLQPMPIHLGAYVWVAADVFIGPGVTVPDGVVVGARSSVYRDPGAWKVIAGNPARELKDRVMQFDLDVSNLETEMGAA